MKQIYFFSLLFFLLSQDVLTAQQTKNILFLGNSYTYYNNYGVATIMQAFALLNGDTVIYAANAPGGYTLEGHSTNATSQNLIRQGNWDYVVLQEQSQKPSFPPNQVATDVYPFAAQLNDSILAYNPCAKPILFMTWGRENGDQANCPSYPPLCTYYGMQQRLRESYLEMAVDNQGICSPVGAAWRFVRDSFPDINLYASDGSHPSYEGSYLAASVFYATIFRQSPENIPYYGSLADTVAQKLQYAAARVTLDSIDLWHIKDYDVTADFTYNDNNGTLTFTDASANASQWFWEFGDGDTSNLANPTHTYSFGGSYMVTLTVTDSCGKMSTSTQLVSATIISNLPTLENTTIKLYPNPSENGDVYLESTTDNLKGVEVFTSSGQLVHQQKITDKQATIHLPQKGIFIIVVKMANGESYKSSVIW